MKCKVCGALISKGEVVPATNTSITVDGTKITNKKGNVIGVKLADNSVVDVKNATIEALQSAITVGSNKTNKGIKLTVEGCTLKSTDKTTGDSAMYLAGEGTYTVTYSTVEGNTGIQIYQGNLTVSNSNITSFGKYVKNPTSIDGSAISIIGNRTNYNALGEKGKLTVNVDEATSLNVTSGQEAGRPVHVYVDNGNGIKNIEVNKEGRNTVGLDIVVDKNTNVKFVEDLDDTNTNVQLNINGFYTIRIINMY